MKLSVAILLLSTVCFGQNIHRSNENEKTVTAYVKVNVCSLLSDPGLYNQKLIEVTGFASHGFEDSSIYEPGCSGRSSIWMEFGGKARTGTMYCCGVSDNRNAPKALTVEGIKTSIIEDAQFKKLDKQLHDGSGTIVRATIRGRFFSGKAVKNAKGDTYWSGYGHLGCCSLFVVQQVVSVSPHDIPGLDYGSSLEQPDVMKEGCGSYKWFEGDTWMTSVERQHLADRGAEQWRYDRPEKVASEGLSKLLTVPSEKVKLEEVRRADSRIVYYWRPEGSQGVRYMVIVNRPFSLSFQAADPTKTIWSLARMYSVCL